MVAKPLLIRDVYFASDKIVRTLVFHFRNKLTDFWATWCLNVSDIN